MSRLHCCQKLFLCHFLSGLRLHWAEVARLILVQCLLQCHFEQRPAGKEEEKLKKSEIVVEADDSKAVPMEMKAGDALIFNCWMLHKSDGNYSAHRDRRILFLRYADADAVEVYNERKPRLGKLIRGVTKFEEVRKYETELG